MSSEQKNKIVVKTIEAEEFDAPDAINASTSNAQSYSDLKRGQIAVSSDAPWWHSQFNLMLLVFALLGLAALLFITLTPAPSSTSSTTLINQQGQQSSVERTSKGPTKQELAPFDAQRKEQARADSQDILADLLDAKKQLEQKGANEWAANKFAAALTLAEQGDDFYQQKNYVEAINQYQLAVDALDAIHELMPAELKKRVAAGMKAIAEGKSQLAEQHFKSALSLDQNHIPALQGLERVSNLDQVLSLVAEAALQEQDFASSDDVSAIERAKLIYQQAAELDGQYSQAQDGANRASELEADKRYRMAMTEGFKQLFNNRYSAARSSFDEALQYKPNDPTATGALRQALASDKRSSLSSLLKAAQRFESQERWSSALSNYQTVLQRDPNQVSAKVGRIRSQARLQLHNSLQELLSDPLAFSRETVRQKAQDALVEANRINNKGALLTQQISDLQNSLNSADTAVKVAFESDALTQVSLKKAGAKKINLGKFKTKKLALKPGRYTLIGTRLGFQDERAELELNPGVSEVMSFTIACTQPIASAGE